MKKFLVQIMVGGELITEIMELQQIIDMLETNVSADYIDDIHVWNVSEFGKADEIDIVNIWCRELSGVASLSDADYYDGRDWE